MSYDSTKVLAGRDFKCYTATYSSTNALPADTVNPGVDWSAPWVDKGLVDGGLRMQFQIDWVDIRVDQLLDPVLKLPNGRTLTMAANLAQFTAKNVQEAMGLPSSALGTVAAGSGTRGHDELTIDGSIPSPNYLSVGFEVTHPGDSQSIRMAAWRTMVSGSPSVEMAAGKLVPVALSLTALPDTSTNPARIAVLRDIIAAL
jgi:hypothetical protein